jgi:hypothetical protein
MLTWHFVAPMVHDFAWAADKITCTISYKEMMLTYTSFIKTAKTIENGRNGADDGQCDGFFQ